MKIQPQHDPDTARFRRCVSGSSPRWTQTLRRLVLCVTAMSVIGLVPQVAAQADSGPVPLATQIADEPISVSAAQFRRSLVVAADAARLSDPGNTADLLGERVLQQVYALDAQTDPAAAAAAVKTLIGGANAVDGAAFDSRILRTMVLFQQTAAADRGPIAATLQRATTEVVALTAQQITTVSADTHAENALGTNGDTESRLLISPTFTPTAVLRDSATLADANPRFAAARDLVWQSATGVSITATAAALLADAPRLKDNEDVQALAALRDSAGALQTTGGAIAGTPTNPADHTIGATMTELGDALADAREAAEASTGPHPVDDSVGEKAVEDARDSQTTLALQTGFLTGGSSAAKNIVDQAGAIGVQVTLLAMSFNDFSAARIGSAALSGNLIGAVMTLLPVVLEWAGVFGPSPEDLIVTQLDNISQQMADFQNAVTAQFILVFESLSRVSAQINDISEKLDRAVIDIEQARVQIGQMYDSLSKLQGSLDAVQNNILQALRNGANSQLRQTISSALGYQERNGSPLPLGAFNDAAAYLHTFATVTARHSPELNTDYPSFDLQNDANQLSTGLASNVDFLDQLPAKRGWTGARLSGATGDGPQLANLDDFVLASRAYAQLMLENPGYVTGGYRRWLGDIQQLGGPLADLTSAISTSDTTVGTRSTLLNRLVCARTSAAFTLTTPCQAQTEDNTPVDTLLTQALGQLNGRIDGFDGVGNATPLFPLSVDGPTPSFDPFVDTSSDTSDLSSVWSKLPSRQEVGQCAAAPGDSSPRLGAMARPDSLTPSSQGVPQVYQWADRMGLGTLNVCYQTRIRSTQVNACQFGADDGKGWLAVNVGISSPALCPSIYWDAVTKDYPGRHIMATYKYTDVAFVWTFSPKDSPQAPIYVQSLVRRGAASDKAAPASRLQGVPNGGYVEGQFPTQYSDDASFQQFNGNLRKYLVANSNLLAPFFKPLATADAVRKGWGDATVATDGVVSYQAYDAVNRPIKAGDPLDQAISGLDPTLSSDLADGKYGRTCATAADPCEAGYGGSRIVSLKNATKPVAAAVDGNLPVLQADVYRKLLGGGIQTAGSTTSGPLHDALVRLDGANAMLSSFLQLGAGSALRQRDLTSLPGSLPGSKALIAAMKAQLAGTTAGRAGVRPTRIATDALDPGALSALDKLLPAPTVRSTLTTAASSPQVTAGPVNPALQSTNDQLALTAVALGAPASARPTPVTPATPGTPATPPSTPTATPGLAIHVAPSNAWVSGARVDRRYHARVTVSGGTDTYTWSRRGKLPAGLKGAPTKSGRGYVIEGRPVRAGVFTFTLTVTDAAGASTVKRCKIRVR